MIYALDLSDELQEILNDNEVDLRSQLRGEGLDVRPAEWPEEIPKEPSGTRSAALVILATGATSLMLAQAISRILLVLGSRPPVLAERKWTAAKDEHGNLVYGPDGKPIVDYIESQFIADAAEATTPLMKDEVSIIGLKISCSTGVVRDK